MTCRPVVDPGGWPRLEVVDRRREPPGSGCSGSSSPTRCVRRSPRTVGPCASSTGGADSGCWSASGAAHLPGASSAAPPSRRPTTVSSAARGSDVAPLCVSSAGRPAAFARPGVRRPRRARGAAPACRSSSDAAAGTDGDATGSWSAPKPCCTARRAPASASSRSSTSTRNCSRRATVPPRRPTGCWPAARSCSATAPEETRLLVQTRQPDHDVVARPKGQPEPLVAERSGPPAGARLPAVRRARRVWRRPATPSTAAASTFAPSRSEVLGPTDGVRSSVPTSARDLADALAATDLAAARAAGRVRVVVDPPRD